MVSIGTVARKVMGLPEAPPGRGRRKSAKERGPANPWEELARKQAADRTARPAGAGSVPVPHSPAPTWTPQDERSGAVFFRRLGRGLLWAVVVLMCVTGVRAWFVPPTAEAPRAEAPKTAPVYPDAEAQAVAARFARAYLGWEEAEAEERAALLAAVLPADSDTAMGWDGKGRQDVLTVQPGTVTPGADHQARVRVEALIRAGAKATGTGKKKTPAAVSPARWVALDVPVVHTAGRVIVTGPPGLVGIPTTGPRAPEIPTARTDPGLTPQTKAPVETFFAAYAAGDTEAVTAPGASVPPLPAGVTYGALVDWAVDAGTGEDRSGTARVSWAVDGGATVEQVYRVELTQVSSPDARRWQVSAVHGGVL